jgi:hypothetical protein
VAVIAIATVIAERAAKSDDRRVRDGMKYVYFKRTSDYRE